MLDGGMLRTITIRPRDIPALDDRGHTHLQGVRSHGLLWVEGMHDDEIWHCDGPGVLHFQVITDQ